MSVIISNEKVKNRSINHIQEPSTFVEGTLFSVIKWRLKISMFMDENSIRECISTLKVKNNEGFDRIPQRILSDGVENLIIPHGF